MSILVDIALPAFITLFVIIDPVAIAPIFAALTSDMPKPLRRKMAVRACLVATSILLLFAFVGEELLNLLGISLDSFRVAGGLMLFMIALEMVFEKRNQRRENRVEEAQADIEHEDISVFPLGVPLIAGPGAITTVMLVMNEYDTTLVGQFVVSGVLAFVILSVFLTLLIAGPVLKLLGASVTSVVTRVLGIILAALAVQYIVDGVRALLT